MTDWTRIEIFASRAASSSPFSSSGGHVAEAGVELVAAAVEHLQVRERPRHREVVREVRPAERDSPGGDHVHVLRLPRDRRHRHAAAERLRPAGDVRLDVVELLGPARRDPKAREHLVEDHEHLVLVGDLDEPLQVVRLRRDHARVRHHRLEDHGREPVAVAADHPLERGDRVVGRDHHVVGDARGESRRSSGAARVLVEPATTGAPPR